MTIPPIGLAIAATGGYAPDNDAIERAILRLREQGCTVHNYYDHARVHQRFAATDGERLAQLHDAARDPEVQVVMALRGQYGISRILPRIDFRMLAESGKIFVGYSDLTALHMGLMAKTGAISYAGPMFAGDFAAAEPVAFTLADFWHCLAGPIHTIRETAYDNPSLEVEGTIWGGNLAMFVSLLGTPYFPQVDGGILFFEDVAEHPYRVERMLIQLDQAGVLARQKAIVLGDFGGYRLGPADNGYDFSAMLAWLRATLPVPVITGLTFGHVPKRVTIPFGAHAQLKSGPESFTITLSDYPTVRRA